MSIKLISLNIETDKHLNLVLPFLKKEKPDVVCMQEVFQEDLPLFEKRLKLKSFFIPTINFNRENIFKINPRGFMGLAILTNKPIQRFKSSYLIKAKNYLTVVPEKIENHSRAVILVEIKVKNEKYVVANTHFVWSIKGRITTLQKKTFIKLLKFLKPEKDLILCGDFNTPRGKIIWKKLAGLYKDNIPPYINSTLDNSIHKNKTIKLVVDGLFTSKSYKVNKIKIIDGVSDHKAIVSTL